MCESERRWAVRLARCVAASLVAWSLTAVCAGTPTPKATPDSLPDALADGLAKLGPLRIPVDGVLAAQQAGAFADEITAEIGRAHV